VGLASCWRVNKIEWDRGHDLDTTGTHYSLYEVLVDMETWARLCHSSDAELAYQLSFSLVPATCNEMTVRMFGRPRFLFDEDDVGYGRNVFDGEQFRLIGASGYGCFVAVPLTLGATPPGPALH
jgi:hypothetical protein